MAGSRNGRYGWSEDLETGLTASGAGGDRLLAVPKTELHAHGLLSMPLEVMDELAETTLVRPPNHFDDFSEFSGYIRNVILPFMTSLENVMKMARGTLDRLVREGVVYAEVSFDMLIPRYSGFTMSEFARALIEERTRVAESLTVCFEAGLNREWPPDELSPEFDKALDVEGFLGSVDLYGDERKTPASAFGPLYRRAAEAGLKLKAHAGELAGPESVREAIDVLQVSAVQHGIRAIEDPGLVRELAARGVTLNTCPTSNVRLGVVPSFQELPIRRLLQEDVRVTVNSDDFCIFGSGVDQELRVLHELVGLDVGEVEQVVVNGLRQAPPGIQAEAGLSPESDRTDS